MKHTDSRRVLDLLRSTLVRELVRAVRVCGGSYEFRKNADLGLYGNRIGSVRVDRDDAVHVMLAGDGGDEVEVLFDDIPVDVLDKMIGAIPPVGRFYDVTEAGPLSIDPEILLELTQYAYPVLYPLVNDGVAVSEAIRNRAAKLSSKYRKQDWEQEDFWLRMEDESERFIAEELFGRGLKDNRNREA